MKAGSNPGVRTIGVTPTRSAAITIACTSCRSKVVCSMSIKAASKPARPISSTICGSGMPPTCVPSASPPALAEDFFDAVLLHRAQGVVCLRMNCFIRKIAGAA